MAWIFLVIAGLFEVVWATAMKWSNGLTRWQPSLVMVAGMIISFYFLSLAVKELPMGTAYAVWTGIGAIGSVLVGILWFHEPAGIPRLVFLLLIVIGIAGLKFTSPE